MSRAALAHDSLLPRPPGGNGAGAVLALVAHAGLIAALTVSVEWRSRPPEVVSAELWSALPQVAAPKAEAAVPIPTPPAPAPAPEPPAPPPPPPPAPKPLPKPEPAPARVEPKPPDPAIAIEQAAERRKAEARKRAEAAEAEADRLRKVEADRKRAEAKRLDDQRAQDKRKADEKQRADDERKRAEADKKKREQEAREAKAEEERLAKLREAQIERMMGQAGEASSRGTAARDSGPSSAYAGRVAALIRRSSVFTGQVPGNPAAEVEVSAAPSGTIIARRLVKSSGHKPWDDAVLQAIDKAGTLPRDVDGRVPAKIIIAFRPSEE